VSVEEHREVLSVAEVTRAISDALERHLPARVWVRGEVNGVRQGRGNTYFDLIETDAGGKTLAKLPVAVLSWQRREFDADLASAGLDLEGGMDVLVAGPVTFWGQGGQLRLEALRVDPAYTLGVIARRRREVLERIAAEGLTRHNARHSTPLAPLRLGLVAADGSDAAADVRRQLRASGYAFAVTVVDARVQGANAPGSVAAALGHLARLHASEPLDVVLLARGGGSEHDLSAFDDERVVRAIIEAPFPVWTGIGHEQDEVAADVVAHTAWPTPTAAARGLVDTVAAADGRVGAAASVLASVPRARIDRGRGRLERATGRLAAAPSRQVEAAARRLRHASRLLARGAEQNLTRRRAVLDGRRERLAAEAAASVGRRRARLVAPRRVLAGTAPRRPLARAEAEVRHAGERLVGLARLRRSSAAGRVDVAEASLRAADPQRVLERGFVQLRSARGATIARRRELPHGEPVTARFADGEAVLHSPPHVRDDADDRSPR